MAQLTRREFLNLTGVTAAVIGVSSLPGSASTRAATVAWNHDPASPIGPNHWDDIGFPTCGQGMRQSPVNIATDRVAAYRGAPLLLRYQSSELSIENTGHVVEVPIPAGVHDTLQVSGDRYELVQDHFHAPSEHAVDARLADVEAHFVHTNAQGATVVVGVFFRRGPESDALLDRILLSAPRHGR
jgi:carbonic anhydrase